MPDTPTKSARFETIRISVWLPKRVQVEIQRIADAARRLEDQADTIPPGQRTTFSKVLNEKLVAGMGHDWQEPTRAAG